MDDPHKNAQSREEAGLELVSVGLGLYDGYQNVVVLSYKSDDDGKNAEALIMNVDFESKRYVPADLVIPYGAPKETIPT